MTSFTTSKRNGNQAPLTKAQSDNFIAELTSPNSLYSTYEDIKTKSSSKMFSVARNLLKIFSTSKQSLATDSKLQLTNRIPLTASQAKRITKYESFRIQIVASYQTLGFTLAGYCPCHIAKLESNSSAASAGLQVGDLVIKINGKNVSRAKCESIVKIIRSLNGEQEIVIDVLRSSKKNGQEKLVINSTENAEYASLNQVRYNKYKTHLQNSSIKKLHAARKTASNPSSRHAKKINKIKKQVRSIDNLDSEEKNLKDSYMPSPIPHLPPIRISEETKKYSVTDSDYKTQSCHSELEASLIESQKAQDFCHMNACEGILNLEEKFIDSMQKGVQQYSRPLRHCMMISAGQHQSLFQNIEKILAISEYQLNQLISHDDSALFDMFNTIGKLYENKLRMSAEAFDIYLNGVEKSFALLKKFTKSKDTNKYFSKFLVDSNDDINMDLKTFLLLPLYYVVSVYKSLQLIKSKTSQSNSDYQSLSNLLTSLDAVVEKATITLNKLSARQNNPFSDESGVENDSHLSSELMYSGDLRMVNNGKWSMVSAQLFRDRLCISNQSTEVEILLSNILHFDFNTRIRNEFQFSHMSASGQTNVVIFKAETFHEKLKWKCLFKN